MTIKEPSDRISKPTANAVRELIRKFAPAGDTIPKWLENLVIVAYQNGRYDEASAETFDMSVG